MTYRRLFSPQRRAKPGPKGPSKELIQVIVEMRRRNPRYGYVDGVALCRMFNKAVAGTGVPKYLSSDNDPRFTYHRWLANLRILACVP